MRFRSIETSRFVLPNGLTVILAQDPRADVFAYHTWMRVGSKHENPGKTGLAHLLEHLMFKATKKHGLGVFDREIEKRGAETNAATWVDWTYYHQTLAHRHDNLRTVIDLEADRLTGLILDQTTFASELSVVQNERRMSVDDSVLASLGEAVYGIAFTQHGYRWPTIGYSDDLESMTLEDVRQFYKTHYAPDRAVVVVAGAIDMPETLKLIEDAYSGLEPNGYVPPARSTEPPQDTERKIQISRKSQAKYLSLAYKIPGQMHPDTPALEALTELLFVGDNAALYHALVTDAQLASDVEGYMTPFADPGLCEISITLKPGSDVDSVVACVDRELDRIPALIDDALLEKAKNGLELAFYDSLRDADGVAEVLGHCEVAYGDFAQAFQGAERLHDLNTAKLRTVCERYFQPRFRTVGVVNPI